MSLPAVHPGIVLAERLAAIGVRPAELARQIAVPANRISQIINARRGISGDTALRLGHWFGTEPQWWLDMQNAYELELAKARAGQAIGRLPVRPP